MEDHLHTRERTFMAFLRKTRVLKCELEFLIEARRDLIMELEIAEEKQLPMNWTHEVKRWILQVQAEEIEVEGLITTAQLIHPSNPETSIYGLENPVAAKLQAVRNLIKEGAFLVTDEGPEDVADDQLTIVGMESIFEQVWRCLEEEEEGIIGVYGMGGVGKTALLKQINNKLLHMQNDFYVVIWVEVSRDLQLEKIQQQIGENIGLFDESWKTKNSEEKSSDISKILMDKNFVLLMDDLWERVDLTRVGVPLPNPENSTKIVFTTRSLEICSLMEADRQFKINCLADQESWKLFQTSVGVMALRSSRPEAVFIAKQVSKACYGLPLALISIGRAMASSRNTPEEWSDVLGILRRPRSSISGSDDRLRKDIYYNLKLSYDNLQHDVFKSCLLYCCLFPRFDKIEKRELIDCWIGEGFLDDRVGAQSQGYYIIDVLLSACLLEEVEDDKYVRMHYWIKDMSLWIANEVEKEKRNFFVLSTDHTCLTEAGLTEKLVSPKRMSVSEVNGIRFGISNAYLCPHLETLFVDGKIVKHAFSYDWLWFSSFSSSLKVLNLSGNSYFRELPSGISNLVSVQKLNLSWTDIRALPIELGALKKLKCLNLEHTRNLCTIPRQLISKFSMLHVLRLWRCGFLIQPAEDCVVSNDAQLLIEELLCLKNLNLLSITLSNSHALQKLLSSSRLQSCTESLCIANLRHPRSMKVSLTDLKHLNTLSICHCENLEELDVDFAGEVHNIRESRPSFYFLVEVCVSWCSKMRDLTWLILAPNLKHLKIIGCPEMEEIINVGKLSECPELMGNLIPFSKLKFLTLKDLPNLRSIYWSVFHFPDVKNIFITGCPKLQNIPRHLNKLKKLYDGAGNCTCLEDSMEIIVPQKEQAFSESTMQIYFVRHRLLLDADAEQKALLDFERGWFKEG